MSERGAASNAAAEDLKATAEDLINDAERLRQIEQLKLVLEPGDPRLAALAEEGDQIAVRMRQKTEIQKALASNGDGQ